MPEKEDLPESAENNPDIDKYGYKQDNISRANKEGDFINEFYNALGKGEWRVFYSELAKKGYAATANVGTLAPIVVNDKLIISERKYTTSNEKHDYIVVDAYKIENYKDTTNYVLHEIVDIIEKGMIEYDQRTIHQKLIRFIASDGGTEVLSRYSRSDLRFDVGGITKSKGIGSQTSHGNSQERLAGEGLSLRDKSSIQEDDELLDEPSPFNESEAVDKFKHGGVNDHEPTVTGERGEYYFGAGEELISVDGAEKTGYEWSQVMRRLETEARKEKEIINTLKASGDNIGVKQHRQRLNAINQKYNQISEQTGIPARLDRMTIVKGNTTVLKPQNVLTNNASGSILNNRYRFNSQGDPLVEATGDAEISNPKEIDDFKKELKMLGVELKQKETENLGYAPGIRSGKPGIAYISKGASYGAWCHEMQHVRDDSAAGWSGMRILMDKDEHYMREVRAYQIEIDIAEKLGRPDIADRLRENLEKERIKIYGK